MSAARAMPAEEVFCYACGADAPQTERAAESRRMSAISAEEAYAPSPAVPGRH